MDISSNVDATLAIVNELCLLPESIIRMIEDGHIYSDGKNLCIRDSAPKDSQRVFQENWTNFLSGGGEGDSAPARAVVAYLETGAISIKASLEKNMRDLQAHLSDKTLHVSKRGNLYRQLNEGRIYYYSKRAFSVHGPIYEKYLSLGADEGFLGLPTSDIQVGPFSPMGLIYDGKFCEFEHGVIYWSSKFGAHEVHGRILDRWNARGRLGKVSLLGYPQSDETGWSYLNEGRRPGDLQPAADDCREVTFTGGYIMSSRATPASYMSPAIHEAWYEHIFYSNGYLGYPVADSKVTGQTRVGKYGSLGTETLRCQRGAIVLDRDTGQTSLISDYIRWPGKQISAGSYLEGWMEVTIQSSGAWQFRGHMHGSNRFMTQDLYMSASLPVADDLNRLFVFQQFGSVDGVGDFDWDQKGFDGTGTVRSVFQKAGAAPTLYTWLRSDSQPNAEFYVAAVLGPPLLVGAAIVLAVGSSGGEKTCDDWEFVQYTEPRNDGTDMPSGGFRKDCK